MATEQALDVKSESCDGTDSYNIYRSNVCYDSMRYYCDDNTPHRIEYSDTNCSNIIKDFTLTTNCISGPRYTCVEKPEIDYKEMCNKTYYADNDCQIEAYDYVFKVDACNHIDEEDSHVYIQYDGVLFDFIYTSSANCSLFSSSDSTEMNVSTCTLDSKGSFKIECQRTPMFKYKKMNYLNDESKIIYEQIFMSEVYEDTVAYFFYENYEMMANQGYFYVAKYSNYSNLVSFPTNFLSATEGTPFIKLYNDIGPCMDSLDFQSAILSNLDPCENFTALDISSMMYATLVNENEFNLTYYRTPFKKRSMCDNSEIYGGKLNECVDIGLFLHAIVSKISTPSVIANSTCDQRSCNLIGNFTLNDDIEVYYTLNIINTTLTIPISLNGSFHVTNFGIINIEESNLALNIENDEEYNLFIKNFNDNGTYQYTLIDGEYVGAFSSMDVNLRSSTCDSIESDINHGVNRVEVAFKLSKKECEKDKKGGLKWWIILLICVGIVIVLATTFIILLLCNKKFRSIILPYRRK